MPLTLHTAAPVEQFRSDQPAKQGPASLYDEAIRQKAQEFEAVFISQMLTFSGLDKALTLNGGEQASAFAGFYIDQFAEKIAEKGGFGLAEKIYAQMSRRNESEPSEIKGTDHVNSHKL